jgi:pre-mRNA-splicing factor 38A
LTAETIIDRAIALKYCGGTYGGNIKPTPFLCLVLKLLQLQPEKEIVIEFIRNEDFKYLRALGVFYMRLVGKAIDVYNYLEPLYNDYRKLAYRGLSGWKVIHMDEFVDSLLTEEMVCDVALPHLPKRMKLEELSLLPQRKSVLDMEIELDDDTGDLEDEMDEDTKSRLAALKEIALRASESYEQNTNGGSGSENHHYGVGSSRLTDPAAGGEREPPNKEADALAKLDDSKPRTRDLTLPDQDEDDRRQNKKLNKEGSRRDRSHSRDRRRDRSSSGPRSGRDDRRRGRSRSPDRNRERDRYTDRSRENRRNGRSNSRDGRHDRNDTRDRRYRDGRRGRSDSRDRNDRSYRKETRRGESDTRESRRERSYSRESSRDRSSSRESRRERRNSREKYSDKRSQGRFRNDRHRRNDDEVSLSSSDDRSNSRERKVSSPINEDAGYNDMVTDEKIKTSKTANEKVFDKMFGKRATKNAKASITEKLKPVVYEEGSVEYWNAKRQALGLKPLRA